MVSRRPTAKAEGRQRRLLYLRFGLDVFQDFPFDFGECPHVAEAVENYIEGSETQH
jgi:hypothetical protein